jgi:hypothetical protein
LGRNQKSQYPCGDLQEKDETATSASSVAKLAATQTLFDALTYLRGSATSHTLWVDALCIDQDSPAEKSQQVARMHKSIAKPIEW